MVKKEFSKMKRYRLQTKALQRNVKFLKRLRHRKARRIGPDAYKETGAWDLY